MINNRKHIKNFAAFFLAFYSFFIFYAALHTHGVRTFSNNSNYQERHNEGTNHPFLDSENNCRLVSFSNSLYTCCTQNESTTATKLTSTEIQLDSQSRPLQIFKRSLQLRAPPTAS
jgi:hypothetical protein